MDPAGVQCHVYIHTGGASKQLPYVINDEIVFPKDHTSLVRDNINETFGENIENSKRESSFDTANVKINATVKETLTKTNNPLGSSDDTMPDEDHNKILHFDSNQLDGTHWTFNNRTHSRKQVQNIDTVNFGPMFSKLITKVKVKFVVSDFDQDKLHNIVSKNNSKPNSSKMKNSSSNVPSIIKLSKSFESKCEGCRFDFYKIKNGTKWDLVIIRNHEEENDQSFKESTEEAFEIEHPTLPTEIIDIPSNFRVKNDQQNQSIGGSESTTPGKPKVEKELLGINMGDTKGKFKLRSNLTERNCFERESCL